MSPLEIVIFLPIIAALAIWLGAPARITSITAALINLLIVLGVAARFDGSVLAHGDYTLVSSRIVLENPAISFAVGIDGMSLILALLTTLVTLAAVWQIFAEKAAVFHIASLLISAGALGAFLSTDVFFIYAFHELALIPTFLMIALHGHGDQATRRAVAWKITVYLGVGSLVLLAGLAALVLNLSEGPVISFDLTSLAQKASSVPAATQEWIFFVLLIGFGTLVSLFPMHSWAAPAYATAPTSVAMLHAGVLKKFGLYGLLRIALPLLPLGAQAQWIQNALLLMLLGNILVMGLVTIHQNRLDDMLANSSVMHMGYIFLGIAAGTELALKGAVILMFAHGVSIALSFALCGRMRNQVGTLEFDKLGGLATNAPWLTVVFAFAAFASIGLPGLANFAGEIMIFAGTFDSKLWSPEKLNSLQWTTILALWGVVISAVYMLRAYRKIFFGTAASGLYMKDPAFGQRLPLFVLAAVLLIVGCHPGVLLDLMKSAWVVAGSP
jgi:NADH-quinone oxidoreductase subunit M